MKVRARTAKFGAKASAPVHNGRLKTIEMVRRKCRGSLDIECDTLLRRFMEIAKHDVLRCYKSRKDDVPMMRRVR
jgi:hypothetical protein